MPTNQNVDKKETMYDKEVARFAKRIAMAYSSDKIRLVTSRNVRRAVLLHDIDAINDVIRDIPNMPDGFRSDFCDAFIGEDMAGLDLATPAILGYAYRAISLRARANEPGQQKRLDKLAARIDDLSTDFANSGGMVVRQHEWPLINMSNIANENEDFAIMLDARMADVAGAKKDEMMANSDYAKKIAKDYDEAWNLDKIKSGEVDKLSEHWNEIYKVLDITGIRDDTWEKFIKCKMLDSKGRVIPQFIDKKGVEHEEYEKGFKNLEGSRYEAIIELVKHDIAKRYVADVNAKIDKEAIEKEFNAELLIRLYEIYAADQIAQGAAETPEQFADPEFRKSFEKMLEPDGDGVEISDKGYNAAIETQTDATVGWFARVRNKVGGDGKNLRKLWKEVNHSLEYVDDMADVRMSRAALERRKKRREFAGRILTGFSSSFIASALITTIATAAAAKVGLTLASGLALVGGGATLGIMGFQVARWIRNQKKKNLSVSWEEFKKDKQLLRSLGTSGLAIIAMVLGVKGWAEAAMGVGIGAMALGAYNNGRRMFQSAQDSGMSQRQKIAWTIASVASVILGALGGRMGAQWGIGKYNELNPDNTLFQNKEMITGEPKMVSDEVVHERTVTHYSDGMLKSAKEAVEGWYAHDYPNHPEILQQDIDAINQYNIDHDTNLDPYRILRAMKISQPSRLAYTPGWSNTYNVPQELISQAAHAVGGGVYDPAGMEAAKFLDANYLGESGNVGEVPLGHTVNKTYSPITELPTETTETVIDQVAKYEPTYDVKTEPVDIRAGYGAFGNYPRRKRINKLGDRVGSFLDRVRNKRRNEPVTENITQFTSDDGREEKLPTFTMDEPQEQQFPPVVLDERDQGLSTTGENTPSPVRREFVVPPISSKKLFPELLFKDIKKPSVDPSRVQESAQPVQWHFEDMPVALPDPETRKYEPYYDFALTEGQAERWNNLHKQLATVRAKMSSAHADKYIKLRKQAKRLTDEINSFAAELGNPSAFEIEQALAEIERRKKLKDSIAQYERHMRNEKSGDTVPLWRKQKWEEERTKLLDKIASLGGADSLDESNLRFATPKHSRLEQKRAEIAQREADRQQPHGVFEMPERIHPARPGDEKKEQSVPLSVFTVEPQTVVKGNGLMDALRTAEYKKNLDPNNEHYIPKALERVALQPDITTNPIMKIRGVPVNLMDLTGTGIPITQNGNRAMVVVDVDGLRIPFFLANGNEPGKMIRPGKWYPLFDVSRNGSWLFQNTNDYLQHNLSPEINAISQKLNTIIGDIRNYDDKAASLKLQHQGYDGTVGGVDAIETVDPELVFNLVDHQPKREYSDVYRLFWLGENIINSDSDFVATYLGSVADPGYVDEEYNLQRLVRKGRERGKEFFSGIGNFADRVRGRLLNRDDDSNERK